MGKVGFWADTETHDVILDPYGVSLSFMEIPPFPLYHCENKKQATCAKAWLKLSKQKERD